MDEPVSSVYVLADDQGRITRCDGGYTTPADLTGWTKIDEGTGDKYNLCQSHYFQDPLYTDDGVPRYKLVNRQAVERTNDEIAEDLAARPQPAPTAEEQMRADIDFLAAMQGVTL